MTGGSAADRGAAALIAVVVVLVLLTLVIPIVLTTAQVLGAVDRTRAAADAAALAVLAGSALAGGDGRPDVPAGQVVAAANDAEVMTVDLDGWPLRVVIEVRPARDGPLGALLDRIRATATATLVPP